MMPAVPVQELGLWSFELKENPGGLTTSANCWLAMREMGQVVTGFGLGRMTFFAFNGDWATGLRSCGFKEYDLCAGVPNKGQ